MKPTLSTSGTTASYRQFDLAKARFSASRLQPAAHQSAALGALNTWFGDQNLPQRGGIVVLPTGGGKTFTAVRFLCRGPLSKNYKVLWLAQTHHLLDQANSAFAPCDAQEWGQHGVEVGLIAEPRAALNVRVVSGTPDHCGPDAIKADDDVVIATLQTMTHAVQRLSSLPGLKSWLKSAEKLIVIFDEAHHSPAPTYRRLIDTLRQSHPQLLLLGLTATPTYSDQSKSGWLAKLFPQGILHQISANRLILDEILAQPIFETCTTQVVPEWDEREYKQWLGTYSDLPEKIVSDLAQNRERNILIADTYANNAQKYGKTIIFAERWYQCEQICELLQKRDIKAGAVYSRSAGKIAPEEEDNRRDRNKRELASFRRGELDVLINVRMLTEGTNVPDVQTVFLTRQTTSEILMTQMVGRALRGPKFGGTNKAYVVAFQDSWQRIVPWANLPLPIGGVAENSSSSASPRPPLQLISLEIMRQLAQATDHGANVAAGEFTSLVPVGWYATTFDTLVRPATERSDEESQDAGGDDIETLRDVILVYDRDQDSYERFITHVQTQPLDEFVSEEVTLDAVYSTVEEWQGQFFASDTDAVREERLRHLLDITRHIAQRIGSGADVVPPFLPFEQRQSMDLDVIAQNYIEKDLGPMIKMTALQREYERTDSLWKIIYPNFGGFKSQYDACENRLLMSALPIIEGGLLPQLEQAPEPSEAI